MRIIVVGHPPLGEALATLPGYEDCVIPPVGTKGNAVVAVGIRGVPRPVKDGVLFVMVDVDPEGRMLPHRLSTTGICCVVVTDEPRAYQESAQLDVLPLGATTIADVVAAVGRFPRAPQIPAGHSELLDAVVTRDGLELHDDGSAVEPAPVDDGDDGRLELLREFQYLTQDTQPAAQQPPAQQPPSEQPQQVPDWVQPAAQQPAAREPAPAEQTPEWAQPAAQQPQQTPDWEDVQGPADTRDPMDAWTSPVAEPSMPTGEEGRMPWGDAPTAGLPGWLTGDDAVEELVTSVGGNGHRPAHDGDCTVIVFGSMKGGAGKCLAGDTRVIDPTTGEPTTIAEIVDSGDAPEVIAFQGDRLVVIPTSQGFDNGAQPTYRLTTASGRTLVATPEHPLLTADGWVELQTLKPGETVAGPGYLPEPAVARIPADGQPTGDPTSPWRGTTSQVAQHVAELYQSCGYIDSRLHVGFETGQTLGVDLQDLLLRLRVTASLDRDAGQVVVDRPGVPVFHRMVGPYLSPSQNTELAAVAATVTDRPTGPTFRPETWERFAADVDRVAGDGTAETLVVERQPDGGRAIDRVRFVELTRRHPQQLPQWRWVTSDDVRWDPVVTVESTGMVEPVYDLEVPGPHCFLAGGLIVHNSTAALLAAAVLAEETDKKVALVDANFAQSSQSTVLQLRDSAPTIFDLARGPFDPAKLKKILTQVPGTKLDVLLSPPNARKADPKLLSPELWVRAVTAMRGWYDYIVVDTEVAKVVGEPMFDRFVFQVADLLVVVVAPGEAVTNNLVWLETVTDPYAAGGQNFPMDRIHVLLNMARDGIGMDEEDVEALFARYSWIGAIPMSEEVQRAAIDSELHLVQSEARDAMTEALYILTGDHGLDRPGRVRTVPDRTGSRGGLLRRLWRS